MTEASFEESVSTEEESSEEMLTTSGIRNIDIATLKRDRPAVKLKDYMGFREGGIRDSK